MKISLSLLGNIVRIDRFQKVRNKIYDDDGIELNESYLEQIDDKVKECKKKLNFDKSKISQNCTVHFTQKATEKVVHFCCQKN